MTFITLHHICCGRKIVGKYFLTKRPNAGLAQNHLVNLLPLCQENPLEVSHTGAAGEEGNCDPESTVQFLLLKCFLNLLLFWDLRVIEDANQKERAVRKPAA